MFTGVISSKCMQRLLMYYSFPSESITMMDLAINRFFFSIFCPSEHGTTVRQSVPSLHHSERRRAFQAKQPKMSPSIDRLKEAKRFPTPPPTTTLQQMTSSARKGSLKSSSLAEGGPTFSGFGASRLFRRRAANINQPAELKRTDRLL